MLTLAEEIMILSIREKKSGLAVVPSAWLSRGLASAILLDLVLHDRISINENQRLIVEDGALIGELHLDDVLERIRDFGRPRRITYWLGMLLEARKRMLRQIVTQLVSKGVLTKKEKIYQWVLPCSILGPKDASAKYWVKRGLRELVLAAEQPTDHMLALLWLVKNSGLTGHIFTRDERKEAVKRIQVLLEPGINDRVDELLKSLDKALTESA